MFPGLATLKLYALLVLFAAPFLTWSVQELRMMWAVRSAIARTQAQEEKICNARVAAITASLNEEKLAAIQSAKDAWEKTSKTPTEADAVQKLCDADPRCRDKKR